MKIVIDTNVFISGLHWDGLPRKVLRMWQSEKCELRTKRRSENDICDFARYTYTTLKCSKTSKKRKVYISGAPYTSSNDGGK